MFRSLLLSLFVVTCSAPMAAGVEGRVPMPKPPEAAQPEQWRGPWGLPLTQCEMPVWVMLDQESVGLEAPLRRAIDAWNYAVGFEVLRYGGGVIGLDPLLEQLPAPFVIVDHNDFENSCGLTRTRASGLLAECMTGTTVHIATGCMTPANTAELALTHELGHVLGLTHPTKRPYIGIMMPSIGQASPISAAEAALVRRIYAAQAPAPVKPYNEKPVRRVRNKR